ncbi:formylglycine-generating enzyme family protein [Planctomicrobium sp. SH661]|uniref:formylglycine-generating enzyme family protein n=1 Tax=Planctomicrobium sp. SH661 TaxID=3448124 RepID=UPI003F5BCF13
MLSPDLYRHLPWTRCIAILFLAAVACGLQTLRADEIPAGPAKVLETFAQEFVTITPGTAPFPEKFQMGSSDGRAAEQPAHEVILKKPFRISRYEVWQQLYQEVMGNNPSRWPGPRNSAERMTWLEAQQFCRSATTQMRELKLIAPQERVRLQTEAEWEYCCRAGTQTRYSFGNEAQLPSDPFPTASTLNKYAWHTGNAAGNDPAVGVLQPNPWGLYDLHGYLWEYCEDSWTPNYSSSSPDGHLAARDDTNQCVIRGGSWKDPYPRLTSTFRLAWEKSNRSDAVGFRCVISSEDPHAE